MKLVSNLTNTAAAFSKDENGSIIPTAAIMMTALVLSAGVAVDYTRLANSKNVVDTALDAAILDAGVRLGQGQPVDQQFEDDFRRFFQMNVEGRGAAPGNYTIVNFAADATTGEVSASAQADIDATLMGVIGWNTLTASSASAGIFEQADTEVTIMLDLTGSMNRTITGTGIKKIDSLKSAAKDAVRILLEENPGSANTRVGLVPYSYSVNAGSYADDVTFGNPAFASTDPEINVSGISQDCVTERSGPEAFTDAFYTVERIGADPRIIDPSILTNPYGDNSGRRLDSDLLLCPTSTIQPLTNDANALNFEIENMTTGGYTGGHIGIAWSYYMLSENWRALWDTPNKPAPYTDPVNKVAILMTDGIFNTFYSDDTPKTENPWALEKHQEASNTYAVNTCAEMRQSGIIVYSIAFDAPPTAEQTLRDCATPDNGISSFFFSATSDAELRAAFEAIANDIGKLRLNR